MSVGEVSAPDGDDGGSARFDAELESTEEVRLSWEASGVRWANQWGIDPETPTAFAATDRRILFDAESGTNSIGYRHVRAVKVDAAGDGLDLSMAFVGCGGLCLLVGLLVATDDLANGVGLVLLSVMLLVAGSAVGDAPERATVTLIIDNERQRLSFSVDEDVGERLAELASRF
ncbi:MULTISPECIES: hypothetical protein [Halorussus]|uniref:hypothetical protein n=1 Tax=Halorussus TaxID=1070314 RepID=UPI000E212F5F|nr:MULTISPECIES: hypothetical protein [Halorussus]NHN58652.1 hypothetical protein [Halorussus sp. JP-T4]